VFAAIAIALPTLASPALAHERHEVGQYVIEMGWRDEPALAGVLNAVELEVRAKGSDQGIAGAEKTLSVSVSFGGLTDADSLEIRALGSKDPGVYEADIIPTRPGDYIFRLRGKIGDQAIDERFESGPGRFEPVQASTTLQWPDRTDIRSDIAALRDELARAKLIAIAGVVTGALAVVLTFWLSLRARRRISAGANVG